MQTAKKRDSFEQINQLLRSHRRSRVIFSAFELGVMDKMTSDFKSAKDLAEELHLSTDGLERLLTALCAQKIVKKKNKMYRLADEYDTMFEVNSEDYIGDLIRHEIHLHKRWLRLSESIQTGLPIKKTNSKQPMEDTQRFIKAMENIGQRTAPLILEKIQFRGDEHVFDLGGGPGKYMKALCEKYPNIQVTLFDKPDTIKAAQKILRDHRSYHQMHFKQGDFFTDNLGKDYDTILISNVIHIYGFDELRLLLNKCYQILRTPGRLLIKDYFLDKYKTGPEFATLFSLHMFLSTDHGRCYSESEFYDLIKQAGFKKGKRIVLTENSLILEGLKGLKQ